MILNATVGEEKRKKLPPKKRFSVLVSWNSFHVGTRIYEILAQIDYFLIETLKYDFRRIYWCALTFFNQA